MSKMEMSSLLSRRWYFSCKLSVKIYFFFILCDGRGASVSCLFGWFLSSLLRCMDSTFVCSVYFIGSCRCWSECPRDEAQGMVLNFIYRYSSWLSINRLKRKGVVQSRSDICKSCLSVPLSVPQDVLASFFKCFRWLFAFFFMLFICSLRVIIVSSLTPRYIEPS